MSIGVHFRGHGGNVLRLRRLRGTEALRLGLRVDVEASEHTV